MASRAWKLCSKPGCPTLVPPGTSRCEDCAQEADLRRGTSTERGYGVRHRKVFRKGVLDKHPICVLCLNAPSTVADHYPLSRRELVAAGHDPDDPAHGRGLCKTCHDTETATHQPGGWHAGHTQ
ncbi:hypothetical protein [Kribbella sp. CA-293567]|uniref:hypothetical protein n=1 Tax=Kribbella sp. CA-293567 TaxID=3002436 RepID=UPI0022DD58A8|nr:hypothetical protein [Kribbella sp. CA-293567]WBQ03009.1 hypothetical protein OX958_23865 [Kribbella sp. CA-293567]